MVDSNLFYLMRLETLMLLPDLRYIIAPLVKLISDAVHRDSDEVRSIHAVLTVRDTTTERLQAHASDFDINFNPNLNFNFNFKMILFQRYSVKYKPVW